MALDNFWADTAFTWSKDRDVDGRHYLVAAGAHRQLSENLLLGGMFQFESAGAEIEGASGEIRGRGWMVGPYVVSRHASRQLYFEGWLLYGRSGNEIEYERSGSHRRQGSFNTARWLAHARVEGGHRFENGVVMIPLLEFGHTREKVNSQQGISEMSGPDPNVTATRLQLGTEFVFPVETRTGDMNVKFGLGVLGIETDGGETGELESGFSGHINVGADYWIEDDTTLAIEAQYSGFGQADKSSLGGRLSFSRRF